MREMCVSVQVHKCLGVLWAQRPDPSLEPFAYDDESSEGDDTVSPGDQGTSSKFSLLSLA